MSLNDVHYYIMILNPPPFSKLHVLTNVAHNKATKDNILIK